MLPRAQNPGAIDMNGDSQLTITTRPAIGGWLLLLVIHALVITCANGYFVTRDSYRTLLFNHSATPSIHALTPFVICRLAPPG
jgi:hypothetical protein